MAHDINGVPFFFAAWITHISNDTAYARIIDHAEFPSEDGGTESDYGIEESLIILENCSYLPQGSILLSDRAIFTTCNGKDIFRTDRAEWVIGKAYNETDVISIMKKTIIPGTWQDPRVEHYRNEMMEKPI